jgi:hypothetical protein
MFKALKTMAKLESTRFHLRKRLGESSRRPSLLHFWTNDFHVSERGTFRACIYG